LAATGCPLPWPGPEALALKLIAHHLWDPAKRELEPSHGIPTPVRRQLKAVGLLRTDQPHAPASVRRRLASWITRHRWRGLNTIFMTPAFKTALRLAVRASTRPKQRKSEQAITRDVLDKLLATFARNCLADTRDRALLLTAFASGGRRRSELASLSVGQIKACSPVPADPQDPDSTKLPCLMIQLGRTKRADADAINPVLLIGRPTEALTAWLERTGITAGAVFRAIDRWGHVRHSPITGDGINDVVKRRCRQAGLDPSLFGAHGLRSGYLPQAAQDGVSLVEAMQQSQHRSMQQAANYYNESAHKRGKAARLY
jgi:integrase